LSKPHFQTILNLRHPRLPVNLQGSDIYISLRSPYEELEEDSHVTHRERRKR
jgi:hypothetical protein